MAFSLQAAAEQDTFLSLGRVRYQESGAVCIMRSFVVIRVSKSRSAVANLIDSSGLAEVYKIRHCTLPLDLTSGPGSATATGIYWRGEGGNRRAYTILMGNLEGKRPLA